MNINISDVLWIKTIIINIILPNDMPNLFELNIPKDITSQDK